MAQSKGRHNFFESSVKSIAAARKMEEKSGQNISDSKRRKLAPILTVLVATNTSIHEFQNYSSTNDFADFDVSGHRLLLPENTPIALLRQKLSKEMHIPCERQALWLMVQRENATFRPYIVIDDEKLNGKTIGEIHRHFEVPKLRDNSIHIFLEILPPLQPSALASRESNEQATPGPAFNTYSERDFLRAKGKDDKNFILLFFKEFNPELPVENRLSYKGSLRVDCTLSGEQLVQLLRPLCSATNEKDVLLEEELQPSHIQELDTSLRIDDMELNHGDILCIHFYDSTKITTVNARQLLQTHFKYLQDRCILRILPWNGWCDDSKQLSLVLSKSETTFAVLRETIATRLHAKAQNIRIYGLTNEEEHAHTTPLRSDLHLANETKLAELLSSCTADCPLFYAEKLNDNEIERFISCGKTVKHPIVPTSAGN